MVSPEYWVVRLRDGKWECRHVPAGSSFFDDEPRDIPSSIEAFAAVPAEFTQVIGDTSDGGASLYRAGDWDAMLRAAGLDPMTWYARNVGNHWTRGA